MNKDAYAIWLQQYKKIHRLGGFMNEALEREIFHAASTKYKLLDEEMRMLIKRCKKHLENNRVPEAKGKWVRDKEDKTTWISDPSFAYAHLM